ncbi:uncharacterized protein [Rutidosis leptorrhynchoides]|uniref:uncharacterized protein n=1 Tax=Rutidosis leptorrhynchoides TaxID=125765 RepID=UPI003A99C59F
MDTESSMEALMKAGQVGLGHAITQPIIKENFDIKGPIFHLLKDNQFRGTEKEDANAHIRNFKDICHLFNISNVESNVIYLHFFPWSLKDEAKEWLNSLPEGDITSWDTMVRFGQLLRGCPQHGLDKFKKATTFYKGCDIATRRDIDTSAGGNIMSKTAEEAEMLINKLISCSFP